MNECEDPNFCLNGGECRDLQPSFKCTCPPGWLGMCVILKISILKFCKIIFYLSIVLLNSYHHLVLGKYNYNELFINYGQNILLLLLLLFLLYIFFSGPRCQIKFFPCSNFENSNNGEKYCMNNGQCQDKGADRICHCNNTGFTGKRCEVDIDECIPKPCQNNATCLNLLNNYNCTCTPGYTGKNCHIDINECVQNPCLNGRCLDKVGMYQCDCYPGYNGTNCENDIEWCAGVNCQHGGRCEDLNTTFTCHCLPGYTGKMCEIDVDECVLAPCQYMDAYGNLTLNLCIERSNLTAMLLYNFTTMANETDFYGRLV